MLILMGLYAMYVGFLYNDQFSLGVDWFGTTWSFEGVRGVWSKRVYPFGLDPAWHDKSNSLLFYNSFKMKFAVIFGVTQMILGVCLKFMNVFYHHDWVDLFCEAIPQMLYLVSFFGWMVVLIVMKWLIVGMSDAYHEELGRENVSPLGSSTTDQHADRLCAASRAS